MKRTLACLAALALALPISSAQAEPRAAVADPLGDIINQVMTRAEPILAIFQLKATLYHSGARGVGTRDSLGCQVVPMRTAAVDGVTVRRRTKLFIPQTVGLRMADGSLHDGYWYATDTGGAIKKGRIDLFTGANARSMQVMMPLNLATLTVTKVGEFTGCPSA